MQSLSSLKQLELKLVAKTFHGLETILAQEIKELGGRDINILNRAVSFEADKELLYKSNLNLRTALRILQPIATFYARDEQQLYKNVKKINWELYLKNDQTLAVDSVAFSTTFKHSKFVALKVKDAVCDQFRENTGIRPSVDVKNPDLLINVHISNENVTLSLDSSGGPLNRRGYRTNKHPAPINEVLAAGMILLSAWDKKQAFIDPMCGSGTIVMEAAMIAAQIAPNIKRKEFGFMKWRNFDAKLWKKVVEESKAKIIRPDCRITGSDISSAFIDVARQSALDFGLKQYIDFRVLPFSRLKANSHKGVIITNPPYDERIKSKDIVALYEEIGTQLKHQFPGWEAWIISAGKEAMKMIGLKPSKKIVLYNGALECSYQKFSLYQGSLKKTKASN